MIDRLTDDFAWDADAVVIGASAGGIEALLALLEALPASYPLPILVVLHLPENHDSRLAEVFGRAWRCRCRRLPRTRRSRAASRSRLAAITCWWRPTAPSRLAASRRCCSRGLRSTS